MGDKYEVLPDMMGQSGDELLSASYTANNGIRIQIVNQWDDEECDMAGELTGDGWDNCYRVFDLTAEQARQLGRALIRWAEDDKK